MKQINLVTMNVIFYAWMIICTYSVWIVFHRWNKLRTKLEDRLKKLYLMRIIGGVCMCLFHVKKRAFLVWIFSNYPYIWRKKLTCFFLENITTCSSIVIITWHYTEHLQHFFLHLCLFYLLSFFDPRQFPSANDMEK